MPGKRITDQQIWLSMNERKQGHTQIAAAAKTAISERTGRRIDTGQLTTELTEKRHWRTRKDPLTDVWAQELVPLLENNSALLPATLFDYLCDNYPGRYDNKILRTLQRRIKSWKAKHGPAKDVMFRQIKVPGRLGLSDFTGLKNTTITLTQGLQCSKRFGDAAKTIPLVTASQHPLSDYGQLLTGREVLHV